MNKLLTLEGVLKPILEEHPETRDDDMLLYAKYVESVNPFVDFRACFTDKEYRVLNKISCCASIIRIRRILQTKFKELAPTKKMVDERTEQKNKFVEYVRLSKEGDDKYGR